MQKIIKKLEFLIELRNSFQNNKISKKTLISIITIGGLGLTLGYVLKKNRELTGVIKNQQLTIDGLMKEVKNLSYHLGKKTIINK